MAVQNFTTEELESEEWRPVPRFEDIYAISSLGRIMRVLASSGSRGVGVLSPAPSRGYLPFVLRKRGRVEYTKIHQVVAEAFIGPCPEGHEVNHIDTNKANNKYQNLEYVTHAANMKHAGRMGLMQRLQGERHPRAKLNSEQIREIRNLLTLGVPTREIAARFSLNQSTISKIGRRIVWRHII